MKAFIVEFSWEFKIPPKWPPRRGLTMVIVEVESRDQIKPSLQHRFPGKRIKKLQTTEIPF